ncbi:MAG: DUF1883 domain-containing protein [Salibacteraceae bacterium]
MKYLRCPIKARKGERLLLHFSLPTRVMLLDTKQLNRYREGQSYQYRGGHREESPQQFEIYRDGEYHAIVELGGHYQKLEIQANVEVLPPAPPDFTTNHTEHSNAESVVYDAEESEGLVSVEAETDEEIVDSVSEDLPKQE